MIPLMLSLLVAGDLPEIRDMYPLLGLDTLPPAGQVNVVVRRTKPLPYPWKDLEVVDSILVERGNGTGRRISKRSAPAWILCCDNWEVVEEGFLNGLAYPDVSTRFVFTTSPDTPAFAETFRKSNIRNGERWTSLDVPGYPRLHEYPTMFTVLRDYKGREIERGRGDSIGFWEEHMTDWGMDDRPTREADYSGGAITYERVTSWVKGKRAYMRETRYNGSEIVVTDTYGDTIATSRYIAGMFVHEPPVVDRTRLDGFGNPAARWREGYPSSTNVDTTYTSYDSAGRHLATRYSWSRAESWTNWDQDGHRTSFNTRHPNGGFNNSDVITLDSSEWVHGRLASTRMLSCSTDSIHPDCYADQIATYSYATLSSVGTTERPSTDRRPHILREANTLTWTAPLPDGAVVSIRTLDGRTMGTATFRDGRASIPRQHRTGILAWSIDAPDSERLSGTIMP